MNQNEDAAIERTVLHVEAGTPGIGVVMVPPGQHAKIGAALAARLSGLRVVGIEALASIEGPQSVIACVLPRPRKEAALALVNLNAARTRTIDRFGIVLLLLTRVELAEMERQAPDVSSAKLFVQEIPFEPDPAVDEDTARTELARWQFERFGRLDLRGFVRSETEDVSWSIEDIYQDLDATDAYILRGAGLTHYATTRRRVADRLEEIVTAQTLQIAATAVVLGHPGSGKTFLLRWLAIRFAREASFLGIERAMPLFASLAAYAQTPGPIGLYEYVVDLLLEAEQPVAHTLAHSVDAGRVVFLLDGLDEVGDDTARRRIVESIEALRQSASRCLIVTTSRIVGYDSAPLPTGLHLMLAPFGEGAVRGFLIRWCELYARDRLGASQRVIDEGRAEGEQLALDVRNHKDVRELAKNPLMLTVLAIVHRSGVRLPDHRVELYDHATRVLVERWNRVRSVATQRPPPLKAADAVRLLGPIALRMARRHRTLILEQDLRAMLGAALAGGNLRGVATPDEAIEVFRTSLGLLVEQGPGLYSFLHLTLAEYFAAWEVVRTGELENLADKPTETFYPEWREVILLAAGVLGVLRADDARLESLVNLILSSASRRVGKPSPTVPSLLSGLLADDPGLSPVSRESLVNALVPTWWFGRQYGSSESLALAVQEATRIVQNRIMNGQSAELLRTVIAHAYGSSIQPKIYRNLVRGGAQVLIGFLFFLASAEVDYGPVLRSYLLAGGMGRRAATSFSVPVSIVRAVGNEIVAQFSMSRFIDEAVRAGSLLGELEYTFTAPRRFNESGRQPWAHANHVGENDRGSVTLEIRVEVPSHTSMPPKSRITGEILIAFQEPGSPAVGN